MKNYRDNGAVGALLDEYEKAILELQALIENLSSNELTTVVDTKTTDLDCRSIQTILSHVVHSGYAYAIYIRQSKGEHIDFPDKVLLPTIKAYQQAISAMFKSNEHLFVDYPNLKLEEHDNTKKMLTNWGQNFDAEQIIEHAIVHVLRHRRQIERFLVKLRGNKI